MQAVGPVGEKVDIDGVAYTIAPFDIEKPQEGLWTIDVAKRAPDMALDPDKRSATVDLPVKITADGTKSVALSLSREATKPPAAVLLKGVAQGPVVFEGEPAPPGGAARSLYFPAFDMFFGKAANARELDLVALDKPLEPRASGTCGPYGTIGNIPHRLVDREKSVYERRTGKLRAKKTFDAKELECPRSWTAVRTTVNGVVVNERAATNAAASYPDPEKMRAWLKTFVR